MLIGEAIREYRVKSNLTFKGLFEKTGIPILIISQIENCKRLPSDTELGKLAIAFKIKKWHLYRHKMQLENKPECAHDWRAISNSSKCEYEPDMYSHMEQCALCGAITSVTTNKSVCEKISDVS